jgi:hypothetical protein
MKLVELSDSDYSQIFSTAHNTWINDGTKPHNECRIIVAAFLSLCSANGYIVKDGKVYKADDEKE